MRYVYRIGHQMYVHMVVKYLPSKYKLSKEEKSF